MHTNRPFVQTRAEALRTATWRRLPMRAWRGQVVSTETLRRWLGLHAAARRREAICQLMDAHGVANTERAHRHAYATIWTDRITARLGNPPRPATLVRWRRRFAEEMGLVAVRRNPTSHARAARASVRRGV